MSEVRYKILSDVQLPEPMQPELPYWKAFDLVCDWNDSHPPEQMAWLERVDGECS
ncbi:MAG TPA: hypothetical protein VGF49_12740 [Candidatus Solibacter sp.]|jgi:hypothetical protein